MHQQRFKLVLEQAMLLTSNPLHSTHTCKNY